VDFGFGLVVVVLALGSVWLILERRRAGRGGPNGD
jgi:hypothetical protein